MEVLWSITIEIGQWILENLVFINILLSIIIIFFQKRNPTAVWTWLLVLYFIPIVGFLLYLIVGQDYRKSKMFKMKEIEDEIKYAVRRQEESIYQKKMKLETQELERFQSLILYNLNAAQAVLTDNNDIRIYTDGKEKFSALIEEMTKAKNYIHLQYYIIRDDELWKNIEKVLMKKAQEGIEVRVLFDGMGCRKMRKKAWRRLEMSGVQVAEFFPAFLGQFQFRINYRNHRKIAVIDGKVGFVGGFNIGREYLGLDIKKFGYWRDTHLCIEGAAVTSLAVRFVLDWNYAAKENLFLEDRLFEIPEYTRKGRSLVQIVSSGPDSKYDSVRDNYLKMIQMAEKYIYIQTPYFIPDQSILDALKIAAKSGVEVRIMIPCKPDHPFVYWATYSYLGEMASSGAKCYTYQNGFLHAKTMTIDGLVSCVGTANMDIRSFRLNFEVNATIYSEKTARKLEDEFRKDVLICEEITEEIYGQRGLLIRIREQISRLFSPLL